MRLSVRDLDHLVRSAPGTARPVRLRIGGLTYCLDSVEALHLANQLADAVDEIRNHERNTAP